MLELYSLAMRYGAYSEFLYWSDVSSIRMIHGNVCIWAKSSSYIIVPQSAFQDHAEAEKFISAAEKFYQAKGQEQPAAVNAS
jgi:hypothetical protein